MSCWIHVIGSFVTGESEEKLRSVMGTPVTSEVLYPSGLYDGEGPDWKLKLEKHHEECQKLFEIEKTEKAEHRNVPGGSEGTLNYIITTDSKTNVIGEGTNVYIQGDLRDVYNADEVIEWINRIIKNCLIRDLIVKVNCEFGDSVIIYGDSFDGITVQNMKEEEGN